LFFLGANLSFCFKPVSHVTPVREPFGLPPVVGAPRNALRPFLLSTIHNYLLFRFGEEMELRLFQFRSITAGATETFRDDNTFLFSMR
jgi:hypothetical protein